MIWLVPAAHASQVFHAISTAVASMTPSIWLEWVLRLYIVGLHLTVRELFTQWIVVVITIEVVHIVKMDILMLNNWLMTTRSAVLPFLQPIMRFSHSMVINSLVEVGI